MKVIKLGGAAGIDPEPLLQHLASLEEPWILVHGGNEELNEVSRALGNEPRFVESPGGQSSRVTDAATIDAIQMVYRGRINNRLVARLQALGCNAVGLSGVDGALWKATRKDAIRIIEDGRKRILRGDKTGKIHTINTHLLHLLLDGGYRPVLTLPALADEPVNVDGDRAAAAVASAIGATELQILSNVPGLLRNPEDPSTLVATIPAAELGQFTHFAQGRFRKKLLGVQEALDGGVPRVLLGSANEFPAQGTVIA